MAVCGEEVAAIVRECTDDKSLAKWQRKKKQVLLEQECVSQLVDVVLCRLRQLLPRAGRPSWYHWETSCITFEISMATPHHPGTRRGSSTTSHGQLRYSHAP